jgi:hypothetical protein
VSRETREVLNDLDRVAGVLRARIDEEFRIAERLDAKGRQAFALAAAFFALVQTVSFGGFAQAEVSHTERVALVVVAAAAAAVLAWVAYRLAIGEALQDEIDVRPERLAEWTDNAEADDYVAGQIVRSLSDVTARRTYNNAIRSRTYDRVQLASGASLATCGIELLLALAIRI